MKNEKNKTHLAWYWLSLTAAIMMLIDIIIGGAVGALFAIGGYLFLLLSLASAITGGIKGKSAVDKVTVGSRIGGFFAALGVALVILIIASIRYM